MLNKIVNGVLGMSPQIFQPFLMKKFNRLSRENSFVKRLIINDWEKNGRPSPPPHIIKQLAIKNVQKECSYTTLVETGTYLGDMVEAQRMNFLKIYSIELSERLWQGAVKRFKNFPDIEILQGDSGDVLKSLKDRLISPTIFWLDGHYSGGFTALGDKICPVFEELDAIFNNKNLKHIILIDDARLFIGTGGYPTTEELNEYVKANMPNYTMRIKDDIIHIRPIES